MKKAKQFDNYMTLRRQRHSTWKGAEAGCLRFDLLEHGEGVYSFYEVYRDAEAMSHHKTLPHCNAARGPRAL